MDIKKIVMDAEGIDRSLTRIAYEILEKNKGVEDIVLVGIQTGGVFLADRLKKRSAPLKGWRSLRGFWISHFTGMIF
jgi:pyrimidine operon attenuation protein/uracil phosphoribosyltransferase